MHIPKVTVVTVTYNAQDFIEKTILSIINQTYNNIEYIVVDGASTDNTLNVIKKYETSIDIFISEKDNGIYDAMNKAIDIANGEWIIFMNAGDTFYNDKVIQDVFSDLHIDADFVYGNHIWNDGNKNTTIPTRPLDLMWQRISFSHQSLFSRTELMKKKKFNLSYKIVSDYAFYFSEYMEGKKFINSNVIISTVSSGGVSDVSFFTRTYERWSIVRKYKNSLEMHKFYIKLIYHYILNEKLSRFK